MTEQVENMKEYMTKYGENKREYEEICGKYEGIRPIIASGLGKIPSLPSSHRLWDLRNISSFPSLLWGIQKFQVFLLYRLWPSI